MLSLVVAVLGGILLAQAVSIGEPNMTLLAPTDSVTFYITPNNSSSPECPSASDHCITLDNFAKNELPRIKSDTIALIFLKGIHNSTVPINFVNVQQLIVCGNVNSSGSMYSRQTELPLIQLLSGNMSITSAYESPLKLEIKHLVINGSGQHTLIVDTTTSPALESGGDISMNQVKLLNVVLQIRNGLICSTVNITNATFLASMVEIYGCMFNGQTKITKSTFQSGRQPCTIAVCPTQSNIESGIVNLSLIHI